MALLSPNPEAPVIAIDGLGRTGKGTARKKVLLMLPPGWHSLDSGVLYRLLGLLGRTRGFITDKTIDEVELCKLAEDMEFHMDGDLVIYRGVDQTAQVRSSEIGTFASRIGAIPAIRTALRTKNLSMQQMPGLVTDGREQGGLFKTPFAFFLKTDVWVKAERHQSWLRSQGSNGGDIADHIRWIEERDSLDSTRLVDPTVPCDGAHIIDTSKMTENEVAQEILIEARRRGLKWD